MADQADLPMNNPDGTKPLAKSKTIYFLAGAGLISFFMTLVRAFPAYEWAYEPLNQLQLFLLAGAGVSRATATGPLK